MDIGYRKTTLRLEKKFTVCAIDNLNAGTTLKKLNKKTRIIKKPFSSVELKTTWADIKKARLLMGRKPNANLARGIGKTIGWYEEKRYWFIKIASSK